jgi:acetyltransferase-like isoleucine patch superfamily enzyme
VRAKARTATLVRAAGAVRRLAHLGPDELEGLVRLARWSADEGVAPGRAPGIHPQARVSPLASLRFTERVSIGRNATVGPYCVVWGGWSRTWARVGDEALLSPGVVLVAGNHRIAEPGPVRSTGFDEQDVEVGDGGWIGAHATIIGCRVGSGAVVGAGAVVIEDVPDGAIAVGVPARVVGRRPA